MQFVDTNILLYAISTDPEEKTKAETANRILANGDLALSVQVLQEFYVQATRATRSDRITHRQAARLVESFARFHVEETSMATMTAALETTQRHGISYWDAAILETARAAGCEVVLSEDLDPGTDYSGVRVENPFA